MKIDPTPPVDLLNAALDNIKQRMMDAFDHVDSARKRKKIKWLARWGARIQHTLESVRQAREDRRQAIIAIQAKIQQREE